MKILEFVNNVAFILCIAAMVMLYVRDNHLKTENKTLTTKNDSLANGEYVRALKQENGKYKLYYTMYSNSLEYAVNEANKKDDAIDSLIGVIVNLRYEQNKKPKQ